MGQPYGGSRERFQSLGPFRGDAAALYAATCATDFDIESWDWLEAAAPHADADPATQAAGWAAAWIFFSRWAGTVGRPPAYQYHLERAGIGPWFASTASRIAEQYANWPWARIEELPSASLEHLETSYALLQAFEYVRLVTEVDRVSATEDEVEETEEQFASWALALALELRARGELPRMCTEVADYDGAQRVTIAPTQLGLDEAGRLIPRSRMKRIVDEWCEFFEHEDTPILYLEISSRAPKRLISALRGQSQLRGLAVKWGDYDDLSALSAMPNLWLAELGGATGLVDLTPLSSARSLRSLRLADTRRVTDYSPLASLSGLEELELLTGFTSPVLRLPSIGFLRGMTSLRRLFLGARVIDGDFTPLLERADLEFLSIPGQRGMTPSYQELVRRIPALR
jgi:hypothetical protein